MSVKYSDGLGEESGKVASPGIVRTDNIYHAGEWKAARREEYRQNHKTVDNNGKTTYLDPSGFFYNIGANLGEGWEAFRDPKVAQAAVQTSNTLTTTFGSKQGLDDTRSDVKIGIDSLGGSAMQAMASKGGGWGQAAGILAANQVINSLYQTDSKTTADAIMNSSLMPAPLTMINKMTSQQSHEIQKDNDMWAQTQGHYGGSETHVQEATEKVGEYGGIANLFGGGVDKANAAIDKANREQRLTKSIVLEGRDLMESTRAMTYINSLGYQLLMNGGIDPRYMYAAKHGMKLNPTKIRSLLQTRTFYAGGAVDPLQEGNGLRASSTKVALEQPPIVPKVPQPVLPPIKVPILNVEPSYIDLVFPEVQPSFFKKGGEINIIPEGALHARKHDIDMEGITKKGIPVIDNDGELQAEIENSEIIFRLEVTLKLEKLAKKYNDSETSNSDKDELALEAGKLLADEIINNTLDNTNKLL